MLNNVQGSSTKYNIQTYVLFKVVVSNINIDIHFDQIFITLCDRLLNGCAGVESFLNGIFIFIMDFWAFNTS